MEAAEDPTEAAPEEPEEKGPRPGWIRAWVWLALAVLGAVASVAALGLEPRTAGGVGPGRVEVGLRWDTDGRTRVGLPPLGAVSARTHGTPLGVEASIDRLDLPALQRLAGAEDPETELRRSIADDVPGLLRELAIRTLVASAVIGAVAGGLVPGRRRWGALAGGAGALVVTGVLLTQTWRGYDQSAFDNPRFEGALEEAPDILRTVRRHVSSFEDIQGRVDAISRQVANLYASAALPGDEPGDDVAILHVSDVHLNPLGLEVVARLADQFGVEAVLDTGDLTSFGLPVEARIGRLLADMPVPYYFVPGNHDLPALRQALGAVPNVTLVDGRTVDIAGVRVLGVADPTFTADNKVSSEEAGEVKRRAAPGVVRLAAEQRPDVVAVHDARLAGGMRGTVPLVVAGHLHRRTFRERDGTLYLTVGSTGATGLGSFTVTATLAYEAEVLHFSDGRLTAVDYVSLEGTSGDFQVDRRIVAAPSPP
jgi:predicted phosphodiesterase